MAENTDGIDPRSVAAIIRRRLGFIFVFCLVAAVVAMVVTALLPPVYNATATLLIDPAHDANSNEYSVLIAGEELAITYSQMVQGTPILEAAIAKLGLKTTAADLAKKVQVQTVPNTQLIRLTVADSSPQGAALLANTIAQTFVTHVQELNTSRYADSLSSMKTKMDSLTAQINDTQATVDGLNATKIDQDSKLASLQNDLGEYRNRYLALQQNYQSIQLAASQAKGTVRIYDAAHTSPNNPNVGMTTLWVDQAPSNTTNGYPTYMQMLVSQPVMQAVVDKLSLNLRPDQLSKMVNTQWIPGTQLIQVNVMDPNGAEAVLLADTIAQIFVSQAKVLVTDPFTTNLSLLQTQIDDLSAQINQTQTQIQSLTTAASQTQTQQTNLNNRLVEYHNDYRTLQQQYEQLQQTLVGTTDSVIVSEQAQVPAKKSLGGLLKNGVLAAVVGLMVAFGLAFLLEYMNDTLKTSKDVTRALGLNTLGTIGKRPKDEGELILDDQMDSVLAEDFRILGTNIRFVCGEGAIHTLLVTSPTLSEGKSVVAANLALAYAKRGMKVIVVDADLRIPRIHKLFDLNQEDGLSTCLQNGAVNGSLQSTSLEGLRVLTSGSKVSNSAELINLSRMGDLLHELGQKADLVIIDSAPVLPVADTTILASEVDSVLLVIRAGRTARQAAQDAVERLRKTRSNLIGVVINEVGDRNEGYYRYYGTKDGKRAVKGGGGPNFGRLLHLSRRSKSGNRNQETE